MDNQQKIDLLKKNNPFLSASTSDPWMNQFPDVKSVNKEVFDFIFNTISQKSKHPGDGMACLVLGEAGAGKTHLISRIHKQLVTGSRTVLFSYIQPIEDPGQTFRYLLREIVINLCRPRSGADNMTQFDVLLGKVLTDLLIKKIRIKQISVADQRKLIKSLKEDPTCFRRSKILQKVLASKSIEKYGADFLLSEFPDLDEQFLAVFLNLRINRLRTPALSWLKGVILDEEDAALLKVGTRFSATDSYLEQESRSILFSISRLLAKYGQLLLVCFDRMENLESPSHVTAFGKMLEFLVDRAQAMLPVAFYRGQLWEERFRKELNSHVVSRLESNISILKGCDTAAALSIIKARLSQVYGTLVKNDYFPFDREDLISCFDAEILSPREVIIEANNRLKQVLGAIDHEPLSSLSDILYEEFSQQYKQLLNNSTSVSPDRMRLRHTLNIYLKSFPESSRLQLLSIEFSGGSNDAVDFVCSFKSEANGEFKVAFVIDDSVHHKTVNSKLEKAIEFLEEESTHKVFYVRDRRSKFPGPDVWKVTNKTLRRFKDKGGMSIKLTQAQAMAWYAMTFLHYKVVEGDVTFQQAGKTMRAITDNEFMQFASIYLHSPKQLNLFDLDEKIDSPRMTSQKKKRLEKLTVLNIW